MDNLELFKQALDEAVRHKFDRYVMCQLIQESYPEHVDEFNNSHLAKEDEGFITYVGDKHYFEFELLEDDTLILLGVSDIVYW